jgi:hypothetical protein
MRRSLWIRMVVCVGTGAASTVPRLTASAQEAPEEQGVSQESIVSSPQVELSEGSSPGYSQVVDKTRRAASTPHGGGRSARGSISTATPTLTPGRRHPPSPRGSW